MSLPGIRCLFFLAGTIIFLGLIVYPSSAFAGCEDSAPPGTTSVTKQPVDFDGNGTVCESSCSGTIFWTHIKYTYRPSFTSCTQQEFFRDSSCSQTGPSECTDTCSLNEACGPISVCTGNSDPQQVCNGNYGNSPRGCFSITCGYRCFNFFEYACVQTYASNSTSPGIGSPTAAACQTEQRYPLCAAPAPTPTPIPGCNQSCSGFGSCSSGLGCLWTPDSGDRCRNSSCRDETDCDCTPPPPTPTPPPPGSGRCNDDCSRNSDCAAGYICFNDNGQKCRLSSCPANSNCNCPAPASQGSVDVRIYLDTNGDGVRQASETTPLNRIWVNLSFNPGGIQELTGEYGNSDGQAYFSSAEIGVQTNAALSIQDTAQYKWISADGGLRRDESYPGIAEPLGSVDRAFSFVVLGQPRIAPTPTPTTRPFLKTTGGDVHSNR